MNTLRYVLSAVEAKRLSEDTTALKEGSVSSAPAYKELINRSIVIQKGEHSYNIYGQRIK